jgi:hypothetical protein
MLPNSIEYFIGKGVEFGMRLIPASGSPQIQRALTHSYVHTIVGIVIQYPDLLSIVAELLQTYQQHAQAGLEDDLEALRVDQRRPGPTGFAIANHIVELTQTIYNLYQQSDEQITYQRGAIVELLAYKFVHPRYKPGECLSDHRFVDDQGRTITDQLDVAALSQEKYHLEGYECKLKVDGVRSSNCTNLSHLANVATNHGYRANVGIVSFDNDRYMKRKLARLDPAPVIKLYGLDSIETLQDSPF